jgi:hypothetical protein
MIRKAITLVAFMGMAAVSVGALLLSLAAYNGISALNAIFS